MKTLQFKITIVFFCLFVGTLVANGQNNKDWANFSKYAQANLSVKQPVDVVFMGNSITEGWASMHPEFFKGNNYVGRGISGQVTSQMLVRFRADVINLKPKVVVILAGTNDIAMNNGYITVEHIFENIVSMVELARCNKIKVVLCSVLPASHYPWRPEIESVRPITELNSKIKEYAKANKIPYADYYSVMVDDKEGLNPIYQKDEVHPNLAGYDAMEKVIQSILKKLL
ncbi:SGNH/GDSL hydrolase family protein [Bacteroides sedimenti]|uniref:Acylneuraminate cytidylyltransferase n=1 Tax=Bacteroides sedimenti TaxID=2136147 RepID=A0ABM8IEB8_9BACE